MTEEAQPPQVERAADETPGLPDGQQSRYHEPSYTLPTAAPTSSVGAAGDPGAAASEWARPAPAATTGPATGNSGPAWPGAAAGQTPGAPGSGSGPVPAIPISGPGPVAAAAGSTGVRGSATGAAYPMPEARPGAVPRPGYPTMSLPAAGPGAGGGGGPAVAPPPRESVRAPSRVDAVPGTPFGLVHLAVAPVTSGPAVASLVTGIASVLVAFTAGCLGLAGSSPNDWGGWVAGAFAVLAGLLGLAGVLLGELGRRQTSAGGRSGWPGGRGRAPGADPTAPPVRFTGRGLAIAGLGCAGVGLALTVLAVAVSVLLQLL
ncbi:hypothetical protein [Plantactinospora sp. WMMB782]|uniref:hypothetical protein n=1 Tax=Plantactinospora sp. WMMB782 TaxID=3404121 RepID=UPI003B95F2B6